MTVRNRLLYNECIVLACLIVQVTFGEYEDLSSLDECDSSKERRIAELQKEIAAVRASLHATQRRILQYEDVNWQNDVTELLLSTQDHLEKVTKRDVDVSELQTRAVPPCSNSRDHVRLVNGTTPAEGRVEVFVDTQWSTVSQHSFSMTDAGIVCSALGYVSPHFAITSNVLFGEGDENLLVDESCRQSAGVICEGLESYPVRLVHGSHPLEGRVEIEIGGQWGTLCDNAWDSHDATVICRMLGYGRNTSVAVGGHTFGQGTGPVWLNWVNCQGFEVHVLDCPLSDALGTQSCSHNNDAGVICGDFTRYHVRLVDGMNPWEGRVEMQINGIWGTVNSNNWDNNDAKVVCRMLGYDTDALALSSHNFGPGTGPVWLYGVECGGLEEHLLECYTPFSLGTSGSSHSFDAGVKCQNRNDSSYAVRLVGGATPMEGRIEIEMGGVWGTICDDSWDQFDAMVVCRSLGFSSFNAVAHSSGHFGPGSGPIHMSDVFCSGHEESLATCSFSELGVNSCGHFEDAGVTCNNYPLRLVNGNTSSEGRVEIQVEGQWGTVCDDGWDDFDAKVVCRSLGYTSYFASATYSAFYGEGTGPIFMDSVNCSGNESHLELCPFPGLGSSDCGHHEDAGVACVPNENVRLENGSSPSAGRVEILMGDVWGTVCDNNWDVLDAMVVCNSLGFNGTKASYPVHSAYFGRGEGPVLVDDVTCSGNESNLLECSYEGPGIAYCDHDQDAGVLCGRYPVRLVGGRNASEGRVEIEVDGEWGTVCDDDFDEFDAMVVCRSLGFSSDNANFATSGGGTGPIHMDDLHCSGNESHLVQCRFNGFDNHNCNHGEDVGVACSGFAVRLVGGYTFTEGRVEVYINGVWGTVCDDNWYDNRNAVVVCNSLGLPSLNAVVHGSAYFGSGTGTIWLDEVNCSGDEDHLSECSSNDYGRNDCGHSEDVGVTCK